MSDLDRSARTSRMLLIAGAVVGALAVISWFTLDSGGKKSNSDTPPGTCQRPSGATAGTQTPPALVSTLTAPLGPASTTWTSSAGGTTVYAYCYNALTGRQVSAAIDLLAGHGYVQAPGDDPRAQTNFTKDAATPYGVSLNVNDTLDLSHLIPTGTGGLSIVWTDTAPPGS